MSTSVVGLDEITEDPSGSAICSSGWQIIESLPSFDMSMLDAQILGEFYAAGFFATIVPLMAAKGGKFLLDTLRQS